MQPPPVSVVGDDGMGMATSVRCVVVTTGRRIPAAASQGVSFLCLVSHRLH